MSGSELEEIVVIPMLKFSAQQLKVIAELKRIETGEYPLSNWYVGALIALANTDNPDRHSQAAQSLRELVEKLPRIKKSVDTQMVR